MAFGLAGSSDREYHEGILGHLPVGARVRVRFDPDRPDRATLGAGPNQTLLFLTGFALVWSLMSGFFLWIGLSSGTGPDRLLETIQILS